MRKKTVALVLVVCLAVTGLFAASGNVQFKASVSPRLTGMGFTFTSIENHSTSKFSAGVGGDFVAIFKNGMGPYVAFNGQFTDSTYGLTVAFAYQTKLNNNIDLLATVGPQLTFANKNTTLGISAMCNFDFKLTQSMFARLGVGANIDFVTFRSGNSSTYFSLYTPIPSFALGWRF